MTEYTHTQPKEAPTSAHGREAVRRVLAEQDLASLDASELGGERVAAETSLTTVLPMASICLSFWQNLKTAPMSTRAAYLIVTLNLERSSSSMPGSGRPTMISLDCRQLRQEQAHFAIGVHVKLAGGEHVLPGGLAGATAPPTEGRNRW